MRLDHRTLDDRLPKLSPRYRITLVPPKDTETPRIPITRKRLDLHVSLELHPPRIQTADATLHRDILLNVRVALAYVFRWRWWVGRVEFCLASEGAEDFVAGGEEIVRREGGVEAG